MVLCCTNSLSGSRRPASHLQFAGPGTCRSQGEVADQGHLCRLIVQEPQHTATVELQRPSLLRSKCWEDFCLCNNLALPILCPSLHKCWRDKVTKDQDLLCHRIQKQGAMGNSVAIVLDCSVSENQYWWDITSPVNFPGLRTHKHVGSLSNNMDELGRDNDSGMPAVCIFRVCVQQRIAAGLKRLYEAPGHGLVEVLS